MTYTHKVYSLKHVYYIITWSRCRGQRTGRASWDKVDKTLTRSAFPMALVMSRSDALLTTAETRTRRKRRRKKKSLRVLAATSNQLVVASYIVSLFLDTVLKTSHGWKLVRVTGNTGQTQSSYQSDTKVSQQGVTAR